MASTIFVPEATTIDASWLNDINTFYYTLFQGATTSSQALTAIGGVSAATVAATYETQAHAASTYGTITNLNLKAPLAAPALTGAATTAVTPALHNASTAIANTQFVVNEVNAAVISGLPASSYVQAVPPAGWNWSATLVPLPFTTEVVDTLNEFNPATGVFTALSTGIYQFTAICTVFGSSATNLRLSVLVNGTTSYYMNEVQTPVIGSDVTGTVTISLTATDTAVIQNMSVGAAVGASNSANNIRNMLTIKRIF